MRYSLTKFLLVLLFFGVAAARAAEPVPLPVPDISAKIAEMRGQEQDERFRFVAALNRKYIDSADLTAIRNLRDFALAARKLGEELKLSEENDYDLKEILSLLDSALVRLSMYSPVKAPPLIENYHAAFYAQARFKMLDYWARRIDQIEDTDVISELMDFADDARKHSLRVEVGDEREYIPKRALDLMQEASARLLVLDPVFEGLYDVDLDCRVPGSCDHLPRKARIVVLNTRTEAKVSTTFLDVGQRGVHYYEFVHTFVERGGRRLHGADSLRPETAGEFELQIDPQTRLVSGWIRDSRSAGFVLVQGRQIWSPATFFRDQGPPSPVAPDAVSGIYSGEIASRPGFGLAGTLYVKRITTPTVGYIAGFQSFSRENFKIGEYIQSRGVLNLISVGTKQEYLRWTLAYRIGNQGKPIWLGQGYSSRTGALFTLTFERTGDITDPPNGGN